MQAQLQTTFLKALGDPLTVPDVREIVISNLLLLVGSLTRVDPIVKELNSLLDSQKIDNESKADVAVALALVIRIKGKAIQSAMS